MRISPVVRFLLACCLFASWMGYLIFLAATSSKPIVLSRPQLLVSEVDVLAEVNDLEKPVVVKEVLWTKAEGVGPKEGEELRINNLRDCKRLPRPKEDRDKVPLDWSGPGLYLIPLEQKQDKSYVVVTVPPSPGYPPRESERGSPRLYRATDEVMKEYREYRAP